MKQKKWFFVAIILFITILIGIPTFVIKREQAKTATSYEEASGWVYKCSQPISVKDQGVKYGNGEPSLTPTNQSEANKYCHKVGIE
jgi:phosphoribosylamine-glycine ligase